MFSINFKYGDLRILGSFVVRIFTGSVVRDGIEVQEVFDTVSVKLVNNKKEVRVKCAVLVSQVDLKLPRLKCGVEMSGLPNTMKRHLAKQHDVRIGSSLPLGPYKDQAVYLKDCVRLTVCTNIPLSYWNHPLVHERESRLQSGFELKLSNRLIKRAMRYEYIEMITGFGRELQNTMFSVKFDSATRREGCVCSIHK